MSYTGSVEWKLYKTAWVLAWIGVASGLALFALMLGLTGCSNATEATDARPATIPKAHHYILPDAPQVTEWFASERKAAQRASECHRVPTGKVSDCRELDDDISALHKVYIEYFTAFCSGGGKSPMEARAQLGSPDDDVTKTCASGPCRFSSWKWNEIGQGGIFSVEFALPQHSHGTDWMMLQCNYCSKAGCVDMPKTMP
jgi:hypothetical protein